MSEPKFFSFQRPPDWTRGASYQIRHTGEGLTIRQEEVYRSGRIHRIEHAQLAPPIRDMAVEPGGSWFILDARGAVWRTELSGGYLEALIPEGRHGFGAKAQIAATQDALIVMDPGGDPALYSFSTDRAQIRWTLSDWNGESFTALALTLASRKVWVLARFVDGRASLLSFDLSGVAGREWPIHPPEASDGDESGERGGDEPADTTHADGASRFRLSAGTDDGVWLLDRVQDQLMHVAADSGMLTLVEHPVPDGKMADAASSDSESETCWLLIQRSNGYPELRRIDRNGEIRERAKTGAFRGRRLLPGTRCLYMWDAEERTIQVLIPDMETAIWPSTGRRMGIWLSESLDSGESETIWHKLVLDATGAQDTQVNIRCYASDRKEALIQGDWVDLDDYIRDERIPGEQKSAALAKLWSDPIVNPQDALLRQAGGRYLWLCLELIGSEQHAPVVQRMEVHFPRQSYLGYLPAIYQQDPASGDFLSRYLSLYQTLLEDTDRKIRHVTRSFDADSAAGETRRWLLSWLGIETDDNWSETQLRNLLKMAPVLYRLRGTKVAMERIVEIYTGEKPIILEYDQVKPLTEHAEMGEVAGRLYSADPQVFHVLVRLDHADSEKKRVTLQQLIEAFKPVFATGKLVVLQSWVYMDLHSYLGMNTVLSEPALLKLDGRSSMPHHTITIDVEQENRMDQHTRLGLDARLE